MSEQTDERMTCSVTSARKISECSLWLRIAKKSPLWDSSHHYCRGEKCVGAAVKSNRFFIPKCKSSGEARWILLPRARISPAFKRLPLLKSQPVPTRLHCHTHPVPGQINTTHLTSGHSQVCTKCWNDSFLFCASQHMRSSSAEV